MEVTVFGYACNFPSSMEIGDVKDDRSLSTPLRKRSSTGPPYLYPVSRRRFDRPPLPRRPPPLRHSTRQTYFGPRGNF